MKEGWSAHMRLEAAPSATPAMTGVLPNENTRSSWLSRLVLWIGRMETRLSGFQSRFLPV
jgi:hypothetical protein